MESYDIRSSYMYLVYISKEFFKRISDYKILSYKKAYQKDQKDVLMSSKRNQAIQKVTSTSEGWIALKVISKSVNSRKLTHMKYFTLKASSA